VLFGPKKLPELARQLGKIMGELRRASNEFKFQMEEELRQSEVAERQAAAAAAPVASTPAAAAAPAILPPSTGGPVPNHISVRAQEAATEATAPGIVVAPAETEQEPELSAGLETEAAPHA
jgi:sec-independent protein translocase protein TatB